MRQTLRGLALSPAFTFTAVLSIGIGVGLACSVFAVSRASLFPPVPFPDPARLVEIWPTARPGSDQPIDYLTAESMLEWAGSEMRHLEGVAGRGMAGPLVLESPEGARRIPSEPIVGDWFGTLGVGAARGRVLVQSDLVSGAEPAAVLSEPLWRNTFGEDEAFPGATITLSGTAFTVVGVMPASFEREEKVWVPAESLRTGRRPAAYGGLARLRPGSTVGDATQEVALLAGAQVAADSARFGGFGATVRPFGAFGRSNGGPNLWLLIGVTASVLLVGVANLTHLFLVRVQRLGPSLAVRASLGASTWQLGRALMLEASVIAASGGVLGFVLSVWGRDVLASLLPGVVAPGGPALDLAAVALAAGITAVVAILVGLEPVRRLRRTDSGASLLQRGAPTSFATRKERRTRNVLVATQVAVSIVLVTGATMLFAAWQRFTQLDVGYDADRVVVARPDWQLAATGGARQWELVSRVVERLAARPEVEAVAAWRFMGENYPGRPEWDAVYDGTPRSLDIMQRLYANYEVEPGTIEALGIPLLRGRTITSADGPGTLPVAVVTRSGAEAWWPGEDPLNHQLKLGERGTWLTVVGVVEEIESLGTLGRATAERTIRRGLSQPALFTSARQQLGVPEGWHAEGDCYLCYGVLVAARTAESTSGAALALREAVADVDPTLPILELGTFFDAQVSGFYREQMLLPGRLAAIGMSVTLVLALIGLLGIVAENTTRRSREIGIRVALGAGRGHVLALVSKESVLTVLAGAAAGIATAVWLHTTLSSTLFGYMTLRLGGDTLTLSTFGAAVPILTVVAGATLWEARKALAIDPAEILRSE